MKQDHRDELAGASSQRANRQLINSASLNLFELKFSLFVSCRVSRPVCRSVSEQAEHTCKLRVCVIEEQDLEHTPLENIRLCHDRRLNDFAAESAFLIIPLGAIPGYDLL